MALKKRGFHVDRILNQQREERMRLKAEAVRDRDRERSEQPSPATILSNTQNNTSGTKAILPPSGSTQYPNGSDKASSETDSLISIPDSSLTPGPGPSSADSKRRPSMLEKFRQARASRNPSISSSSASTRHEGQGPSMPGAFGPMSPSPPRGAGQGLGIGAGAGDGGMAMGPGRGTKSTKRVSDARAQVLVVNTVIVTAQERDGRC